MKIKTIIPNTILLFTLLLSAFAGKAQFVTLPDTNFVNWLNANGFTSCMNGNMIDTTCSLVLNQDSINCSSANIHDLSGIQYFKSLENLDADNNQLTGLSNLPVSISTLSARFNQISSFPALPALVNLTELTLPGNQLVTLPLISSNTLSDIDISHNLLTTPPDFSGIIVTVSHLNLSYNQLTSILNFPSQCDEVYLSNNFLYTIPAFPNGLTWLDLGNNQLTSLPPFNSSLTAVIEVTNNITLTCLPELLGNALLIGLEHTGVECIPNAYANIQFLPVCDQFNANGCVPYWNIAGTIYTDQNANCILDSTESVRHSNIKIDLMQNGNLIQQTFSNNDGNYYFNTIDSGTYTYYVDTSNVSFLIDCPLGNLYTTYLPLPGTIVPDQNFSLQCKSGFDAGVTSMFRDSGFVFPGMLSIINLVAGNIGHFCTKNSSGTVQVTWTGPATYAGASGNGLTPVVSGNTLTYTITDFALLGGAFSFLMLTDTTAQAGDQLCFNVTVNSVATDYYPANNTFSYCLPVTNSLDPNSKEVYPVSTISPQQEWLTYTINFQNTGTANAQHIYLLDTLDANLNWSSFELLSFSHEPQVQLINGIVKFNFPNINLPDSNSNAPASHGFVQYKIKLEQGLSIGTDISNTAYIYFDFNAPVITNTTHNVIQTTGLSGTQVNTFSMSPNPVNDVLKIRTVKNSEKCRIIISNSLGQEIKTQTIFAGSTETNINVGSFSNGIYVISMERNGMKQYSRFVKN